MNLNLGRVLKTGINRLFLQPVGYQIKRVEKKEQERELEFNEYFYNQDCLRCFNNCAFMREPRFIDAYNRGIKACGKDYMIHWRVHVALWAASHALTLKGHFVECGVNKGFLSSTIMQYLQWNTLHRHFFLFDTFCGFDEELVSPEEKNNVKNLIYNECFDEVQKNFSEFHRVTMIRGAVPSTLTQVEIDHVAYLSLDMNCAAPEIAAAHYFWPKLAQYGIILLDDYGFNGFQAQKKAFDAFAREKNVPILSLPTGQGLIMKD